MKKVKIGYPCINRSIGCTPNKTFRLASYSEDKMIEKIKENLSCLKKTVEFNVENNLLFLRIGSPLIPFASHPVCNFDWRKYFKKELKEIGKYFKENNFRISMHPDQFVVINSKNFEVVEKSIKEIEYHCNLLDSFGLDKTAKVQIHIGGVYGDKKSAMERFVKIYKKLPGKIKNRLVIENDHISYSLKDCLYINKKTGIPIVFDVFHHECLNNGEKIKDVLTKASKTWKEKDGVIMVDYSSQKIGGIRGSHTESIDLKKFNKFIKEVKGINFDLMLEIKDKERSALKVLRELGYEKNNCIQ